MEKTPASPESEKETQRIEAFSDGVFAIAITLLILDIHVPEVKAGETLLSALMNDWSGFLALLIGFFTILICWINHHYMFRFIHKSNSPLALLNGFKLLIVTITPFATGLLSKHIHSAWSDSAIRIYAFNFSLMGIAMAGLWCYAAGNGFVKFSSRRAQQATTRLYLFAAIFSTSIWLISFVSILFCLILFGVMFLVFIFPERVIRFQLGRNL